MAQEPAIRYRVSRNGSPGDSYWEVVFDGTVIDRGLAPTSAQARAQAMKVAASHAVREPGKSAGSFKGVRWLVTRQFPGHGHSVRLRCLRSREFFSDSSARVSPLAALLLMARGGSTLRTALLAKGPST
jgi:hypothetical protein